MVAGVSGALAVFLIIMSAPQERNTSFTRERIRRQAWWFMSAKVKPRRKRKQRTPNRKSPRQGAPKRQPQASASLRTSTVLCEPPVRVAAATRASRLLGRPAPPRCSAAPPAPGGGEAAGREALRVSLWPPCTRQCRCRSCRRLLKPQLTF